MIEPDDFGLSPIATLAHVGEPTRSVRHAAFWKTWSAGVMADTPRLSPRGAAAADPSDPSATHEFESSRHVRIGCSLLLPEKGRPRAGLVVLHGYENVPGLAEACEAWMEYPSRGLAVLVVRVRGYAGSNADVPQLIEHAGARGGGDWITHGLEIPMSDRGYGSDWSFGHAVADVVNACRALRATLGAGPPIFLHGESFGGALAVLAAAQLADLDEPARLAIGLPTMGDWPWRLTLPEHAGAIGAGGRIRRFLLDHPNLREDVTNLLRVFDAAVHARRVLCPVLCKLAVRDDVVPAPAAAAVFNALSSDPGLKWRFVTRYGHFDGGLADLRRHSLFDRLLPDFLDPSRPPDVAMAAWDAVMTNGDSRPGTRG